MQLLNPKYKINFYRSVKCNVKKQTVVPYPVCLSKRKYVTSSDITIAVNQAKSASERSTREGMVMWDIVYELWVAYQKQQNNPSFFGINDPIENYCGIPENASDPECKIYDI